MKIRLQHIYHKQRAGGKPSLKKTILCDFRHGFTILELVAVLLIIGILATVAISRYTDVENADLAAADTLKAHLRYAHLRAMGDTETWGIEITTNSYTLKRNGNAVNLPGENSATKTFENISGISGPTNIYFSSGRGIPVDSNGNPVENNQNISIGSENITITEFTGFIP